MKILKNNGKKLITDPNTCKMNWTNGTQGSNKVWNWASKEDYHLKFKTQDVSNTYDY